MSGVIVSIPSDEKWNVYCESVNALWAQNRKPEIARRIGDEICRQKASAAKVEIEDEWINLLF